MTLKKNYSGMTVNERLYESGKEKSFLTAVRNNDAEKAANILREISVDEISIEKYIARSFKKTKYTV